MEEKEDITLKKLGKKLWFLLWKDNSIKGWFFSVLVLFLFIKLIFFPVLNLVTGTELPLAIVESCSMYHKGDIFSSLDSWWESHESKYSEFSIEKENFAEFNLKKGFNKGDIIFITKANIEKLKVGDVIIFNGGTQNPIIHRIVKITEENSQKFFSTMGDNNNGQLSIEKRITETQIVGKANFKLAPLLGWVKLIFYDWRNSPNERGMCSEN